MSHTTKINETTFIHNGDFSGEVEIQHGEEFMNIPFAYLRGIVTEYVRYKRIAELERADDEEVLGFAAQR